MTWQRMTKKVTTAFTLQTKLYACMPINTHKNQLLSHPAPSTQPTRTSADKTTRMRNQIGAWGTQKKTKLEIEMYQWHDQMNRWTDQESPWLSCDLRYSLYFLSWASYSLVSFFSADLVSSFPSASWVGMPWWWTQKICYAWKRKTEMTASIQEHKSKHTRG